MSEFEIEVMGAGKPRKPEGSSRRILKLAGRLTRALLMRPRALALIGSAAFALVVGTPHIGWDYECRYPKGPFEPCDAVDYCAYYGIQGRRIVYPDYGESCQIITVLPIDWERLI